MLAPDRLLTALLALLLTATSVAASPQYRENDDRDRILFTDGKSERGRLLWRWDPEGEIHWLSPSGKLRRFDQDRVLSMDLVSDRLGAWLTARSPRASLDEEWALVEYARDAGLDGMARAQAYHLLSRDPSNERAHEFLGHQRRGDTWMWRFQDDPRLLTYEQWAERGSDPGHPLELQGEHFLLHTTAEVGRAVDLLFDLERAYHEFQLEFGGLFELRPWEVVRRTMHVWVYRDEDQFPPLTGAKRGYYLPGLVLAPSPETPFVGSGNESVTFYDGQGTHPRDFFPLVAQQLLYNCVLGEKQTAWSGAGFGLYREAATIEVGFGNWFGSQFHGRPGYVTRKPFQLDPADAALARGRSESVLFRETRKALPNLIGLNYEFFHRNDDALRNEMRARASAFFAYLMDPQNTFPVGEREGRPTRPAILEYMRSVYLSSSGSSSSKFDEALGTKIEQLADHYEAWLSRH